MDIFLYLLIGIFFILSLVGSFIPIIPDVIPIWLGVAVYHFFLNDSILSQSFFISLAFITILIQLADFLANAYFVKKSGGNNLSILGAFLGLLAGMIFLGPLGLIIGPFFGVLVVEYMSNRDKDRSFKIAFSTLIAYLGSGFIKFILQIIIIVWFVFSVV